MAAGANRLLPLLLLLHIHLVRPPGSCAADNGDGTESAVIMVSQELRNRAAAYIAVGQSHSLTCTTKPGLLDGGTVSWTANGHELAKLSDSSTKQFGNDTLIVRLVNGSRGRAEASASKTMLPSDIYRCLVKFSNGLAVVGHPVRVSVAVAGRLKAVVRTTDGPLPSSGGTVAGTEVVLSCSEEGLWSPSPNRFRWYKNSTLLTDSGRIAILPTGVVLISNASREDSGEYQCSAAVEQFNRIVTAWLLSPVTRLRIVGSPSLAENYGKRVVQAPPPHITALEGDTVVVPCIVERSGTAFTTWWGRKGFSNNCSGPEVKYLWIENVTASDSGYYNCVICSHLGDTRANVLNVTHLTVQGAPILRGEPFERKDAAAMQQVHMSCLPAASLSERDYNVAWFKNGMPVHPSASVKLADSWHLSLTSVERSHEGCYQCFVENSAGTASRTFCVLVAESEPLYTPAILSALPAACRGDSSLTVIWDIYFDDVLKVVASTIEYAPASQSSTRRPMDKVIPPAGCLQPCYELAAAGSVRPGPSDGSAAGARRSARHCARCQTDLDQLSPATTYALRLRLYDARGPNGYAPSVNATTAPRPAFQSVLAKVYGSSAIMLDWSQSSNASASGTYTIFFRLKSASDRLSANHLVSGVEQQFYLVKGLKPGDIYQFSVVAEPYHMNCSNTPWVSVALPSVSASAPPSLALSVSIYNSTALLASWRPDPLSLTSDAASSEVRLFYEVGSRQYGPFSYRGTAGSRSIDLVEDGWCEVTAVIVSAGASAVSTVRYENGSACAAVAAATDLKARWLNSTAAAFSWRAQGGCCMIQRVVAYRVRAGLGPFDTTEPLPCDVRQVVIHPLRQSAVYEWMVLTSRKGAVAPAVASEVVHYGHSKVPMTSNLTAAVHLLPDNQNNYGDSVTVELRWMKPLTEGTNVTIDYYRVTIKKADYFDPDSDRDYYVSDTSLKLSHLEPGHRYLVFIYAASGKQEFSAPLQVTVKVPCLLFSKCLVSGATSKPKGAEDNATSLGGRRATIGDKQTGILVGSLIAAFCVITTVVGLVALKRMCRRGPRSSVLAVALQSLTEASARGPGQPIAAPHLQAAEVYLHVEWIERFRRDTSTPDSGVVAETSSM